MANSPTPLLIDFTIIYTSFRDQIHQLSVEAEVFEGNLSEEGHGEGLKSQVMCRIQIFKINM